MEDASRIAIPRQSQHLNEVEQLQYTCRWLANVASIAIAAASLSLGLLLTILLDLAPRVGLLRGREYEAVRIAVELLSLFCIAGLTISVILGRSNRSKTI